jgi:hypothetical protein
MFSKVNNTLPIITAGNPYLSGSIASHWYFNPDIPEAREHYYRIQL